MIVPARHGTAVVGGLSPLALRQVTVMSNGVLAAWMFVSKPGLPLWRQRFFAAANGCLAQLRKKRCPRNSCPTSRCGTLSISSKRAQ